jgi:hypothetical protein
MSLILINRLPGALDTKVRAPSPVYVNLAHIAYICPCDRGHRISFARKSLWDVEISDEEMERIKPLIVKE